MIRTLFGRIALLLLLVFVLLEVFLVGYINRSAQRLQQETTQRLNRNLAANIVKESLLWVEGGVEQQAVDDALESLMLLGPATELYLIDPDGHVLNYHAPEDAIRQRQVDMEPIGRFLEGGELPIFGDDPRSAGTRKVFSVAPVLSSPAVTEAPADTVAYLYIIIGGENYDAIMDMYSSPYIAGMTMATVGAGMVFFLMVALLLYVGITRPIRRLAHSMQAFRERDFLSPPEDLTPREGQPRDEMDRLMMIFAEMSQRITGQFRQMLESRRLRQELVTHVSHDLKTPLASIRGYLESWQINRDTLSPEESARHIEIALNSCRQLDRLVSELFEMSRLEAQEITPVFENFPLDELVDDVIQKQRLKAYTEGMELVCEVEGELPFVRADIGHINRALTNLLDNAIRHSHSHGRIVVRLSLLPTGDRVEVQIIDHGCGIPEAEIDQVFEPYFRASNQEQNYQQGTGLGLAITKKLLSLNHSSIEVQSRVGEGAVFSFSLPVAAPER